MAGVSEVVALRLPLACARCEHLRASFDPTNLRYALRFEPLQSNYAPTASLYGEPVEPWLDCQDDAAAIPLRIMLETNFCA